MRILIVHKSIIPVRYYGGTERVIWDLGKALTNLGHQVTYLVKKRSSCDFARVIPIDKERKIIDQIKNEYDVVHFHFEPEQVDQLRIPYVITMHGNTNDQKPLNRNTVFVSKNHSSRYNAEAFVYNGLDWEDYTKPKLNNDRSYFHFLGKAAWRVKNVQGAIDIIKKTKGGRLRVLGGNRINFNMGLRITTSPKVRFEGMVGGDKKCNLINESKGLIFPIRWHEPFGLAIIESLFYGCPVFGTPYGSLPELVTKEFGFLSKNKSELIEAITHSDSYSKKRCHEYANDLFNNHIMALHYIAKYEKVINGNYLNNHKPTIDSIQKQRFLDWF